jgi:hypothetical protein
MGGGTEKVTGLKPAGRNLGTEGGKPSRWGGCPTIVNRCEFLPFFLSS